MDAGDLLFPDDPIDPAESEQRRIKAELILEASRAMGLDAAAVGDQDHAGCRAPLPQLRPQAWCVVGEVEILAKADLVEGKPGEPRPRSEVDRDGTLAGHTRGEGEGKQCQLTWTEA